MAIISVDILKQRDSLFEVITTVLDLSLKQGADAAEANVGIGVGWSVNVRKGVMDKLEYESDKRLDITLYSNGRKGSAGTSDFSESALRDSVNAAIGIARQSSRDECAGLADAEFLATEFPDLDLYHSWHIAPEKATEMMVECEQMAFDHDQRISNSDGVSLNTYDGMYLYGNTHKFVNGWNWSKHLIDCNIIAKDSHGMQGGGWYSTACDHQDLQDINIISKEAARRTVARLGARKLSTRQAPVIFEASIASSLFSAFITAISGGSLYRRASFLLDKKGKKIFPDDITIRECPHLRKALGSAPFDNDGVATRERCIVHGGILEDYVLSTYSARKLGLQTTGNAGGVHNLLIEAGSSSLDAMIKSMHTGLLVTDMIGFGVNQITGDYSRGASGFWIEDGEIAYPVEEITVAGNLVDLYQNIVAVGNDVDRRGNILTGSVMIESMTIAGV